MSRREVKRDATTMTTNCWMVISANGRVGVTALAPRLGSDEIAIKLAIKLPRALFTRPALSAAITIPAEAAEPQVIEAEAVANIRNAVKHATGLDLVINVIEAETSNA